MTRPHPQDQQTFLCYAKVNLVLKVIGKRPDGYHDIDSLMQTVDLADTVSLRWGGSGITVTCSDPELEGEANLAWKAASLASRKLKIDEGLRISITKRIPVAAGLGGGSTDAACVLAAIAERHGESEDPAWLAELALEVGSDVPYLLKGGLARVRGRGEIVEPLAPMKPLHLAVATPPVQIRSSWAYQRYKLELTGEEKRSSIFSLDTVAADGQKIAAALHNDLERAVFQSFPVIPRIKGILKEMGVLGVVMSGSGPSVLALARDEAQAENLAGRMKTEGCAAFAVRTTDSGRTALE
jgi:4-diphosphocytidyl-2-C-methyl-D-erythritol kinase